MTDDDDRRQRHASIMALTQVLLAASRERIERARERAVEAVRVVKEAGR